MSETPKVEPPPKEPPDTSWMKETEIRKDYRGDPKPRDEKDD